MMAVVLDYTERIDPAALKAAGAVAVCRYVCWVNADTRFKIITAAEYNELRAAGIPVILNWEFDEHDWLSGTSGGTLHAAEAARQARNLGYPRDSVIMGSADYNMPEGDWRSAGYAYGRAFADTLHAAGYRAGVYGPWDVLEWCYRSSIMDAYWQAGMSTSWSAGRNATLWPHANIRQRGKRTVGGVEVDWNEILRPCWGNASTAGYGRGGGRRMIRVQLAGNPAVYLTDGTTGIGEHVHIGPSLNDALNAAGIPHVTVQSQGDLDFLGTFAAPPDAVVTLSDEQLSELATRFAEQTNADVIEAALRDVLLHGAELDQDGD